LFLVLLLRTRGKTAARLLTRAPGKGQRLKI
jgi:hypothetical protein